MADELCPECRGRARAAEDGRLYCQGQVDATDEKVAEAEAQLRLAQSGRGRNVQELDDVWRALAAQRTCGKIFWKSGNVWKALVPNISAENP